MKRILCILIAVVAITSASEEESDGFGEFKDFENTLTNRFLPLLDAITKANITDLKPFQPLIPIVDKLKGVIDGGLNSLESSLLPMTRDGGPHEDLTRLRSMFDPILGGLDKLKDIIMKGTSNTPISSLNRRKRSIAVVEDIIKDISDKITNTLDGILNIFKKPTTTSASTAATSSTTTAKPTS